MTRSNALVLLFRTLAPMLCAVSLLGSVHGRVEPSQTQPDHAFTVSDRAHETPRSQLEPRRPFDPAVLPDAGSYRWVGVLENVPSHLTIQDIEVLEPDEFRPFDARKVYDLSSDRVLWLHFQMGPSPSAATTPWMLEFPKSYFGGRIDYFYPTEGGWIQESAGVHVSVSRWPKKGLWAQFDARTDKHVTTDHYLRVADELPQRIPLRFELAPVAQAVSEAAFLKVGIVLGLLGLMVALSAVLAISYRRAAYAWYSLYAAMSFFAIASYLGVAKRVFWPESNWTGVAIMIFTMAALASQLQFARCIFLRAAPSRLMDSFSLGVVWFIVAMMAVCIGLPEAVSAQLLVYAVAVGVSLATMLVLVVRGFVNDRRFSLFWLLGYLPLTLALGLTTLKALNAIDFDWVSEDVVTFALVFEISVLLMALLLHARTQHAQQVDASLRISLDPLTGFVPSHRFEEMLKKHWRKAQLSENDLALVYVEAQPQGSDKPSVVTDAVLAAATAQTVRILNTVAREQDAVVHIQGSLFALLIPRPPPEPAMANMLARLVALGLMSPGQSPASGGLRLRVVVGSAAAFEGGRHALHDAMLRKIRAHTGWERRSIRYVNRHHRAVTESDPLFG